ncbi:hypothetical protein ABG818_07570, partial [Bifidobacterium adolescentis]
SDCAVSLICRSFLQPTLPNVGNIRRKKSGSGAIIGGREQKRGTSAGCNRHSHTTFRSRPQEMAMYSAS